MIFAAIPPVEGMRKRIRVPPSKSVTNRALLLAALSPGPFTILDPLDCDDADSMIGALSAAGVSFEKIPRGLRASAGSVPAGEITLDVRDSGTACRFLAAYAATAEGARFFLTGSGRLRERPMKGLVEALRALGAEIEYAGREGFPPLRILGRRLAGGEVALEAGQSSQFASALLLVSPRLREGIRLRLQGDPVSRGYLTTTVEALLAVGIEVTRAGGQLAVAPGAQVRGSEIIVPGDYSSAVPLAAAVAIAGGEIELAGLQWPSSQADAGAVEVLRAMGVSLSPLPGALRASGRASRAVTVEASGFPDAVPALAAVAAHLAGESVFSGVEHLKIKESDRIAALLDLLAEAGVAGRYAGGALHVVGGERGRGRPAIFRTRSDHRIVMAAVLLSLRHGGLVENPRSVAKSYPDFLADLFG